MLAIKVSMVARVTAAAVGEGCTVTVKKDSKAEGKEKKYEDSQQQQRKFLKQKEKKKPTPQTEMKSLLKKRNESFKV